MYCNGIIFFNNKLNHGTGKYYKPNVFELLSILKQNDQHFNTVKTHVNIQYMTPNKRAYSGMQII